MKEFETDYIEKLINIMQNNELTEITLEDDKKALTIKSGGYKPIVKNKENPDEIIESVQETEIDEIKEPEENKNLVPIVSNMIGLYYSKPSPNEEPFVKVGDRVKEGQVICIIETIKLMNKVTAEFSGTVAQMCIEDGKPVEFGQVMMYIEKD